MLETVTTIPHYNPVALDAADYERFLPALDLSGDNIKDTASQYLKICDEKIHYLMNHQIHPLDVHKIRSLQVDALICGLFEKFGGNASESRCALMATGGYGRQEMSLMSDIDLLLVYDGQLDKVHKPMIEKILYVLWDIKFEVGHAVRTLSECKSLMQKDQTIFTASLDVRLLVGDEKIYKDLIRIRQKLLKNKMYRKGLIKAKVRERISRLKKYGSSVYLLEPHIKEGEGGLRDLQLIRWLAQIIGFTGSFEALKQAGYIDEESCLNLDSAMNYFLNLRNRLHVLTKRKGDQLNFDAQLVLANDIGYKDGEAALGVEKFMQGVYATAAQVNNTIKVLIQKITAEQHGILSNWVTRYRTKKLDENFKILNGKIAVVNDQVFINDPKALFTVFEHVQNTGFGIHFQTKDLIQKNLDKVDEDFRRLPEIREPFKAMMGRFENLGKALFAMHEVHFFDSLIPEFRKVRYRMQHDAYHVYTVDTHSIFAINELSKLYDDPIYEKHFPSFKRAMLETKRSDLLSFGLLFHDIGKGEGGNHSVIGAKIAKTIMMRLDYPEEDIQIVEFLVISHLLMSHLSQRRDLEDLQMINEFAKSMIDLDRLNMLHVLTWADIRAVSSEAWTDWKGSLLKNLYKKTKALIASHEKSEDYVQRRVENVRQEILKRMKTRIESEDLKTFLQSMSPRYILAHKDEEIFEHFHLITNHDDASLLFTEKEASHETISEILIYTMLNPRVIPLVTGVLLSLDINILTMENFTLTDGHVFIRMWVQSRGNTSLRKAGLVEIVRTNLQDVFTGNKNVKELIAKSQQPAFMVKKPVQKAKTRISIDNDVSAYYTVIDIYTHDRLGLLYDIVKCLVEEGYYVDVSKISTKVEQVVDSFYVKDIFGHKLTSKAKLKEIKQALMDVIEPKDPPLVLDMQKKASGD